MKDTQAAKIVVELGRRVLAEDPQRHRELHDALLVAVNAGITREGKPATKGSASDLIEWLTKRPLAAGSTQAAPATDKVTEEGIYRYTDGRVFRVVTSKANNLYAKEVTAHGWDYAGGKGMIFKLTPAMKMTPEQIAEFGIGSGVCAQCARKLDDPVSKQIGLGTKCGPDILGKDTYRVARKAAVSVPQVAEQLAAIKAGKAAAKARENEAQLNQDRYWDAEMQRREAEQERAAYLAEMRG
jgi:hypothetical protein